MKNMEKVCPVIETSKLIGDPWNILIINNLLTGPKRFGELKDNLSNITSSTLSDKLKFLCVNKIVTRKQFKCIPPKVEYSLTKKGLELKAVLKEVENFGKKWFR